MVTSGMGKGAGTRCVVRLLDRDKGGCGYRRLLDRDVGWIEGRGCFEVVVGL